jgi:hypothetical protein
VCAGRAGRTNVKKVHDTLSLLSQRNAGSAKDASLPLRLASIEQIGLAWIDYVGSANNTQMPPDRRMPFQ